MIAAPGLTTANSECPRTVSLLDVYPTVADLCNLPVGDHLEGKSLKSLLENPTAAWDRPVVTTHGRNNHAVRDERWRYIRYEDGTENSTTTTPTRMNGRTWRARRRMPP